MTRRTHGGAAGRVPVSAYSTFDTFMDVMALGAASLVKKPFSAQQLVSISTHALKRR